MLIVLCENSWKTLLGFSLSNSGVPTPDVDDTLRVTIFDKIDDMYLRLLHPLKDTKHFMTWSDPDSSTNPWMKALHTYWKELQSSLPEKFTEYISVFTKLRANPFLIPFFTKSFLVDLHNALSDLRSGVQEVSTVTSRRVRGGIVRI